MKNVRRCVKAERLARFFLVRPSRLIRLAGRALMIWPVVRPLLPIVFSLVVAPKDARRTNPGA